MALSRNALDDMLHTGYAWMRRCSSRASSGGSLRGARRDCPHGEDPAHLDTGKQLACREDARQKGKKRDLPILMAAMQASFVGAMAIADLVKTTLGPKGMVRIAMQT